jgi:hypothetical protein
LYLDLGFLVPLLGGDFLFPVTHRVCHDYLSTTLQMFHLLVISSKELVLRALLAHLIVAHLQSDQVLLIIGLLLPQLSFFKLVSEKAFLSLSHLFVKADGQLFVLLELVDDCQVPFAVLVFKLGCRHRLS